MKKILILQKQNHHLKAKETTYLVKIDIEIAQSIQILTMSNLNHIYTLLNKDQTQLHLKRKNHSCHRELNQRNKIEKELSKNKILNKKKKKNNFLFQQKSQESQDVLTQKNSDMMV